MGSNKVFMRFILQLPIGWAQTSQCHSGVTSELLRYCHPGDINSIIVVEFNNSRVNSSLHAHCYAN